MASHGEVKCKTGIGFSYAMQVTAEPVTDLQEINDAVIIYWNTKKRRFYEEVLNTDVEERPVPFQFYPRSVSHVFRLVSLVMQSAGGQD